MSILLMTIPVTMLLVTFFVLAFLSAVKGEQFDDLVTPAHGILLDDENKDSEQREGESVHVGRS